ncbi:hypothetical protein [Arenimonas sp.]|uniref:hypothetical protein n=1 Tax=Arenimonas sp. TaxID=1872635 RepID=UPI0039E5A486
MPGKERDRLDQYSLFDRFAIAFVSLIVSVPLALLFWMMINRWFVGVEETIPLTTFLAGAGALAVLAFAMPRFVTDALAWLTRVLFETGRWW